MQLTIDLSTQEESLLQTLLLSKRAELIKLIRKLDTKGKTTGVRDVDNTKKHLIEFANIYTDISNKLLQASERAVLLGDKQDLRVNVPEGFNLTSQEIR